MCFPEAMRSLKHQKQSLAIQPGHTKGFSVFSSASSNTVCLKAAKKKGGGGGKEKIKKPTTKHAHTKNTEKY